MTGQSSIMNKLGCEDNRVLNKHALGVKKASTKCTGTDSWEKTRIQSQNRGGEE